MGKFKPGPKVPPPAYMVSFCDMMTLILTFFILLVSMSKEQKAGLAAAGVGSFIIAVQSHGLPGIMSGREEMEIFDQTRRKFNVPQDVDQEDMSAVADGSSLELIRAKLLEALEPHGELNSPNVVQFEEDSAHLATAAQKYLRMLGPSLQPKHRQTLHIEGHAGDAGPNFGHSNLRLAHARAMAVRQFLIDEFGFKPERLQAKTWMVELPRNGQKNRSVDIRLVTPGAHLADK